MAVKYDAVVIGAGTGGLSAALALASAGKKTLLVEQHNLPGGCSTSFIRGRFEFDASLHEYCGIGSKGDWGLPGKVMMEDYKLNINWLLVPELYRCIGTTRSGKHFDLTLPVGIDNIIDVMEKTVPGSREPMKVFFDLAKECVDAHDYFPITSSTSLTKTIWSKWTACFISNAFPTSCVLRKDRSMRF